MSVATVPLVAHDKQMVIRRGHVKTTLTSSFSLIVGRGTNPRGLLLVYPSKLLLLHDLLGVLSYIMVVS